MVSKHVIEHQLHHIGFNPFSWGRAEVRELCNIMMEGEEIGACVNGEYTNGFALLAATNHRVLLVDKKPFLYLTVEDVRFEQISDFNFRNKFLTAQVTISTANKTMHFTSYNKKSLRKLINCVQQRVIDMRENQSNQQKIEQAMAAQLYGFNHGMLQAQQGNNPQPNAAFLPNSAQQQLASQLDPAQSSPVAQQFATDKQQPDQPAAAFQSQPAAPPSYQPSQVMAHMSTSDAGARQAPQKHHNFLGTYTRSKLPSLNLGRDKSTLDDDSPSHEIYQQGYTPGSIPDYVG